ncbi:Ig-like domain-containing protein [Mycobacterium sp. BMJ-28]
MDYSKYLAPAGALAVALGIGSAIAAPQLAWADENAPGKDSSAAGGTTGTGSSPADNPGPAATKPDPSPSGTGAADPPGKPPHRTSSPHRTPARDDVTPGGTDQAGDDESGTDAQTPASDPPERTATSRRARSTPLRLAIEPALTVKTAKSTPVTAQEATSAGSTAAGLQAGAPVSAAELPSVSVAITKVNPAPSRPSSPIRTFVLNALAVFGFNPDPAPGHPNNPVLEAIWGAYRRVESMFDNTRPEFDGVAVVATRETADGNVAVDLRVDVSDYDGDPIVTSATTGVAFTKNADGTFTYLCAPGFSGTDTVYIGATDTGNHYHQGTSVFQPTGGHTTVAAIAITVTAATVSV